MRGIDIRKEKKIEPYKERGEPSAEINAPHSWIMWLNQKLIIGKFNEYNTKNGTGVPSFHTNSENYSRRDRQYRMVPHKTASKNHTQRVVG